MPDFARPWVLLLLLPLLVLAWRRFVLAPWVLSQLLPRAWQEEETNPLRPPLPWALRIGAVGVLVLALAGPGASTPLLQNPGEGVAVMIALDLSASMDTRDLEGRARLEVALEEVSRFIRARPQDLIGLVTFGEEALTRVPPTTHHTHLLEVLAGLGVTREENGTALGTGLGLATQRISQIGKLSRVVVLLTDGRNNSGIMDPIPVARAAQELEVKVHAIGLGALSGDDPLDERLLREVASLTGGEFFRAKDPQGFMEVMAAVDALEKGPLPAEATLVHESHHWTLLALGILLLILEGLLWMAPGGRVQ